MHNANYGTENDIKVVALTLKQSLKFQEIFIKMTKRMMQQNGAILDSQQMIDFWSKFNTGLSQKIIHIPFPLKPAVGEESFGLMLIRDTNKQVFTSIEDRC